MTKFKAGDRIVNKHGAKGTVKKVVGRKVYVKLDGGLETDFPEDELKFYYNLSEEKRIDNKHVGEKCPKCGTPWSVTHFTKGPVYHCRPCNKKAVDLLVYQPPKTPWEFKKDDEEDMLKEFERLLGDTFKNDDDDDDDFGFFI